MMTDNSVSADRARCRRAAQIAVVEARSTLSVVKHCRQTAKNLPLLIRQHGLGQSLMYLEMRGRQRETSPFTLLLQQIDRLLEEALAEKGNAIAMVTRRDGRTCMRMVRLVELFISELVPLAERLVRNGESLARRHGRLRTPCPGTRRRCSCPTRASAKTSACWWTVLSHSTPSGELHSCWSASLVIAARWCRIISRSAR